MLLAVPALRALRAVAGAPLSLAAQPRIARLLAVLGVADAPLDLDTFGLDALFADDAPRVARLPRASRIVCWLGARDPKFAGRLGALAPGAVVAPSVGEGRDVWEHLLATVGAVPGDWRDPIPVPAALRDAGARALRTAGWSGSGPLIVVHPGAGGEAKRWAARGFASVLEPLADHATILIHRGPADAAAATELGALLGGNVGVLEEPDLTTLAGVLAHATAWLGNDSGPSHLAAALDVASVVLYIDRNLAWRPWSRAARLVVVTRPAPRADVERVRVVLEGTLR